jgi:hypothetical protein
VAIPVALVTLVAAANGPRGNAASSPYNALALVVVTAVDEALGRVVGVVHPAQMMTSETVIAITPVKKALRLFIPITIPKNEAGYQISLSLFRSALHFQQLRDIE